MISSICGPTDGAAGGGVEAAALLALAPDLAAARLVLRPSASSATAEASRPLPRAPATRSLSASKSPASRAARERRQSRSAGSSVSSVRALRAARSDSSRSLKCCRSCATHSEPHSTAAACSSQVSRLRRSPSWTACRRHASTTCASSCMQISLTKFPSFSKLELLSSFLSTCQASRNSSPPQDTRMAVVIRRRASINSSMVSLSGDGAHGPDRSRLSSASRSRLKRWQRSAWKSTVRRSITSTRSPWLRCAALLPQPGLGLGLLAPSSSVLLPCRGVDGPCRGNSSHVMRRSTGPPPWMRCTTCQSSPIIQATSESLSSSRMLLFTGPGGEAPPCTKRRHFLSQTAETAK
mmetsp:Transcript_72604/g.183574  ORF Transcript_72604/g.183574 Transcript_72604/m.183574 type:complete len:351 (+) Transcript_72604:58-1110(+)